MTLKSTKSKPANDGTDGKSMLPKPSWSMFGAFLIVSVVAACLFFVDGAEMKLQIHSFIQWVHSQGWKGYIVMVLAHATAVAVCFPATIVFEWGAGFIFGVFNGVLVVSCSKCIGGLIGFALGRTLLHNWVVTTIRNNERWSFIYDQIGDEGLKFAFLLRLSPVPSWVNNYGLSLTSLSYSAFLAATLFGSLPFILNNVWMGSMVESLTNIGAAGSRQTAARIFVLIQSEPGAGAEATWTRTALFCVAGVSVMLVTQQLVKILRKQMPSTKKKIN